MGKENIDRIEKELAGIDAKIRELEILRDDVLLSDEEYASYVENYQAYYNDEPLSIRDYYRYMDELMEINGKMGHRDADIESLFRQYGERLQYLERRLSA